MFTPKALDVADLKVGDTVAVRCDITYGWSSLLCSSYQVLTISKITPKRAKVSFEGSYLERNPMRESFYEVTNDLLEYIDITKKYKRLADYMYALAKGSDSDKYNIRSFIINLPAEQLDSYIADFRKPYTIMKLCAEHSKV